MKIRNPDPYEGIQANTVCLSNFTVPFIHLQTRTELEKHSSLSIFNIFVRFSIALFHHCNYIWLIIISLYVFVNLLFLSSCHNASFHKKYNQKKFQTIPYLKIWASTRKWVSPLWYKWKKWSWFSGTPLSQ